MDEERNVNNKGGSRRKIMNGEKNQHGREGSRSNNR
jgi:hypothetical protein